jgi:hypothetical protein
MQIKENHNNNKKKYFVWQKNTLTACVLANSSMFNLSALFDVSRELLVCFNSCVFKI